MIKNLLYNLSQSHYGKLFFVLFLFLVFSLTSLFIFYNGFLINFNLINACLFGHNAPVFLNHVPYHSFSILFSSLLHPYFLIGLIVLYSPLIFFKSIIVTPFNYQRTEKILVFISAFLLTWELVTYEYNYYLDSAFYFDRFFLIALTLALLRLPLLTPLYIAFAFVYRSQFNYPVAGFELFDKRLLFDILILFVSFRYIKAFIPNFKFSFVWLVLCVVASNYVYAGLSKIILSPHGFEWLTHNNLANLFMNVHLRGWLADVSEDTISSIWNFLNRFHVPLQFLVLTVELSALFLLRSKRFTIVVLSASFLMHLGIFCCGSMLFWKWMTIDITLIYLVSRNKNVVEDLAYNKFFTSSVVVVAFAFIWLRPYMIGWLDTPANQYFTYEVEDANGTTYQLCKNEMNPYHQWFQYDHFQFLVNKPTLPLTGFGYTNQYQLFENLENGNPETLVNLSKDRGINHFNSQKTKTFYSFIQTYFKNRNKCLGKNIFLANLRAPHHLYGTFKGLLYNNQTPVTKFRVIYNLSFTSAGKPTQVEKSTIHEIAIPE